MLFSRCFSRKPWISSRAFTLIELMVVISIIGVLAAALYPQVGKYISRGRDAGRITALANIGTALDSSRFDYDGKYPDHTGGCVPMTTLVTKHYLVSALESPSGTGYNEGCGNNGQYAYGNLGIGNILMSTMENPQGGNYSGSTAGFTGVITKAGILNALNTKKGTGKFYVRPTNYILNSAIFIASSSGSCGSPQIANTCAAGTVSNYIPASCGGTDTWTCLGSSGSVNDNCSALHVCTSVGDCGTAAGVPTPAYPVSGLCNVGTAIPNDNVGTDGIFNWSCDGSAGAKACSAAKQYTVSFNTYGGSAVASQPVAYGGTATLPSPAPTKGGNVFSGWYGDAGFTSVWNFSTGTITGDKTLHAKWITSYDIIFNGNTATAGSMSNQSIAAGGTANLTNNAFSKTGYSFSGWATSAAGPVVYANNASYTMGSANVTLYAKWNINSYTVTFNSNGGSVVASQNITYNTPASSPAAPTRAGYTFGGWYSDVGLTSAWNFATPITGATTLYAKWTLIPSYSITFSGNTATAGSMSNQSIASGSSANLTINAFSKTGYTFAGWATGATLPVVYANNASYTMGGANVTLYAKWTLNTCMIGSSVFGSTCIVGSGSTTNVASCIGLPTNAAWNTATSITQTWSAGIWVPSEVGTYNATSSATECRFKCSSGTWNGSACVISYTVSGSFGATGSTATVTGCGGKTATADGSGNFSFTGVNSGTICTDIAATRSGYTCTTTTNGPASLSANFTTVAGSCVLDACVISETSSIDTCIIQTASINAVVTTNPSCGFNLKTYALANGWDGVSPANISLTIGTGTILTACDTSTPAFDTDTGWPIGSELNLINNGYIVGKGGKGGKGGKQIAGTNGGPGLKAQTPLHITNNGTIGGGGGGGGGGGYWQVCSLDSGYPSGYYCAFNANGSGGGGGAGYGSGGASSGYIGSKVGGDGTLLNGGAGGAGGAGSYNGYGYGGVGGSLGSGGTNGGQGSDGSQSAVPELVPEIFGGAGGAGGPAIIGNGNIIWVVQGSRYGSIN